jgi:hypothetical protein
MPFATKMSDYPGTLIETPMFGRMQFGVPAKNPQDLMKWNVISNECRIKNIIIDLAFMFKTRTSIEVLTNPKALPSSQCDRTIHRMLKAHPRLSSLRVGAFRTTQGPRAVEVGPGT